MDNGGVKRIKYYSKQVLTVRDFQDQQEYHRQKQKSLLKRFPHGIITGLVVKKDKKDSSDPNDFDGILIEAGLAVDSDGNEIDVPEEGYKVPFTDFKSESPYLSLVYTETEALVGDDPCSSNEKNNRIKESFTHKWDKSPNMGLHVTVALIKQIEGQQGQALDSFYTPIDVDREGGPRIRLDASMVGSEQIQDFAITETKIRPEAVDETKLSAAVISQLVTGGNNHTHKMGDGDPITEDGLHSDVQNQLVTGGDTHKHDAGDGKPIPRAGLDTEVQNQLVDEGNAHDHTDDHGAPIPRGGLDSDVQNQLVTGGNNHKHDAGDGDPIPSAGIATRAVTSDKLDLTIIGPQVGSFSDADDDIEFPNVTKNAIIQVIPTSGALSWSYVVKARADGSLDYKIKVMNETRNTNGGFDTVNYIVRGVVFHIEAGPDQI
jgi:hypothetical protein